MCQQNTQTMDKELPKKERKQIEKTRQIYVYTYTLKFKKDAEAPIVPYKNERKILSRVYWSKAFFFLSKKKKNK